VVVEAFGGASPGWVAVSWPFRLLNRTIEGWRVVGATRWGWVIRVFAPVFVVCQLAVAVNDS
jgi:hypothetical protein